MIDIEQEIKEIKKEILESRGLIIKTNNLINSFGADLKFIVKKQNSYESKMFWNSAVTYIIIAVLSFVGLKLAFDQAEARLIKEKEENKKRIAILEKELKEVKRELERLKSSEREAIELYELIKESPPEETLTQLEGLDFKKFSPLAKNYFNEVKERLKLQLSMENYYKALELINNKEWSKAYEKLKKALKLGEDNPYKIEIKLQLGRVLIQLGRYEEAILKFKEILDEPLPRSLTDDLYWYLAQAQILANYKDDARLTLRRLIKNFPHSQWVKPARVKLLEIRW